MASSARIITTRAQIVTALKTITTANGYQNSVGNVSSAIVHPDMIEIHGFPHICLELGDSVIEVKNDARTLFDELVEVNLVAYVRANTEPTLDIDAITNLQDAMESMVWDLKKLIATLLTVNINDSTNKWNIVFGKGAQLVFKRDTFLGEGRNIGIVQTSFTVRVRALDGSFDD